MQSVAGIVDQDFDFDALIAQALMKCTDRLDVREVDTLDHHPHAEFPAKRLGEFLHAAQAAGH